MTTRTLSLLTPSGHLTLGSLLGALGPCGSARSDASTASPTCTR